MIRQIPLLRSKALAARLAALLMGGTAMAHSDPWGDTHPQVTVKEGNFSIVFNSSSPDDERSFGDSKPVFRTVYSPEGALVAPRHRLKRDRHWSEASASSSLYDGRPIAVGDSKLFFVPDAIGRPGYLLESPDGQKQVVRLPWPEKVSFTHFEDAQATPEGIAVVGKEDLENLKFYWFPYGSTEPPFTLDIGPTVCIYHFPVSSNIVWAGGKCRIAFMRWSEKHESTKLYLWSWKPGEKEGSEEMLDSPGYGNSHLSMAAIGDRLCLAYHCSRIEEEFPDQARIATVFRKAD